MNQVNLPLAGTGEITSFALRCPGCRIVRHFVLVGNVIVDGHVLKHYTCPDPNCSGSIDIKPGGRR